MNKKFAVSVFCFIDVFLSVSCTNTKDLKNEINKCTWYYNAMDYDDLSEYSSGDSQVIAFVDSGISPLLEKEYGDRVLYKYNVVDNSENVNDDDTHGTKMVSIACSNGSYGVYGLASESKILIYKVTDEHGKTKADYLSKAINDAVVHNATIINVSIGGYKNDKQIESAVNYALNNGVTVVAASGDYGDKDLLYPAKYTGVISIQGLDQNFDLWQGSNHEDTAINTFPCENIYAIDINKNGELFKSNSTGTSQAAAIASSYIALIKDYYLDTYKKEISNDELIELLKSIDTFKGSSKEYTKLFCN